MLFNLMAALSLASLGAVAGIASNSQSVDDVELDKSSLIERKNAISPAYYSGNYVNVSYLEMADLDSGEFARYKLPVVSFDVSLTVPQDISNYVWAYGSSIAIYPYATDGYSYLTFVTDYNATSADSFTIAFDGVLKNLGSYSKVYAYLAADTSQRVYVYVFTVADSLLPSGDYVDFLFAIGQFDQSGIDDLLGTTKIVPSIASGLTSVQHYATSLVSGFDALALDNGALTNSMAFAFTLLGIGTAVGICKLTFNWITGRHGM